MGVSDKKNNSLIRPVIVSGAAFLLFCCIVLFVCRIALLCHGANRGRVRQGRVPLEVQKTVPVFGGAPRDVSEKNSLGVKENVPVSRKEFVWPSRITMARSALELFRAAGKWDAALNVALTSEFNTASDSVIYDMVEKSYVAHSAAILGREYDKLMRIHPEFVREGGRLPRSEKLAMLVNFRIGVFAETGNAAIAGIMSDAASFMLNDRFLRYLTVERGGVSGRRRVLGYGAESRQYLTEILSDDPDWFGIYMKLTWDDFRTRISAEPEIFTAFSNLIDSETQRSILTFLERADHDSIRASDFVQLPSEWKSILLFMAGRNFETGRDGEIAAMLGAASALSPWRGLVSNSRIGDFRTMAFLRGGREYLEALDVRDYKKARRLFNVRFKRMTGFDAPEKLLRRNSALMDLEERLMDRFLPDEKRRAAFKAGLEENPGAEDPAEYARLLGRAIGFEPGRGGEADEAKRGLMAAVMLNRGIPLSRVCAALGAERKELNSKSNIPVEELDREQ